MGPGKGAGPRAFKTEGGGEGEVTQEGQAVRALHAEGSVQGRTERQLQKPKPSRGERGRGKRSCEGAGWGGAGRWEFPEARPGCIVPGRAAWSCIHVTQRGNLGRGLPNSLPLKCPGKGRPGQETIQYNL